MEVVDIVVWWSTARHRHQPAPITRHSRRRQMDAADATDSPSGAEYVYEVSIFLLQAL